MAGDSGLKHRPVSVRVRPALPEDLLEGDSLQTQQRVELRYAADKTSLSPEHKLGTVSKVFADGSFQVAFDSYLFDNGKRVVRVRGGRYTYKAHQAASFSVLG